MSRMKCTFVSINKDQDLATIATCGFHIKSMDLYLSKVKLIKKPNGDSFFAPPSESYIDYKTGQKKWANYFWFGDTSADFFQQEAKKAFLEYCEQNKIENPLSRTTRHVNKK